MSDILLIGEIIEVVGISTKVRVYKEKNTSRLVYNGTVVKNVAVGNYVKILKGFTEIIAVIEGEYTKELKPLGDFRKHSDTYNRVLDIKILGHICDGKFMKGIFETPMISNYVYVLEETEVQKIFCFRKEAEPVIGIGKIMGYDNYTLDLSIKRLFASHIGIFGNTGSGKSNTLTKLYSELFSSELNFKKSKFVFIDFNDEYTGEEVLKKEKHIYQLNTRDGSGDKFPLHRKVIEDSSFWSIILEATEKTQKPFLDRTLKSYEYYKKNTISFTELLRTIHENPSNFNNVKSEITELLFLLHGGDIREYEKLFDDIAFHNNANKLWCMWPAEYFDNLGELTCFVQKKIVKNKCEFILDPVNGSSIKPLSLFQIVLQKRYIYELLKGYSNDEHISPLIKRSVKRINEISKVFDFVENEDNKHPIQVISLSNCNVQMKKIVPLLICKEVYESQKEVKRGAKSLHLIIDEAHNVLSENSNRESASWKDYRLEVFEEIIKEGRKFGCFITMSSQRPSDISPTLVSQLHNYFIHRLVNEEDLFTIRKSVAFLDKSKQEMIPILSQGQCVCSGLALDFPVNVQVEELPDLLKPDSKDIDLLNLWQ